MAGLIAEARRRLALWLWPEAGELSASLAAFATATREALGHLRDDMRVQAGALVDLRDEVEDVKADLDLVAKAAAR